MRFLTAYYFMLLYLMVIFKPFVPVISDILSHTFAEAIHVATVHSVSGPNHLEIDVSNTTTDNKHQPGVSAEDSSTFYFSATEWTYTYCVGAKDNSSFKDSFALTKTGFYPLISPPPKLC